MNENDRALLAACREAGLTTPEQVKAAKADASFRGKYVDRLRVEAKRVATIATGRDLAGTVDAMSEPAALEAFITDMGAQADAKFRTSPTQGAQRTTTSPDPAQGADAGTAADGKREAAAGAVIDPQGIYERRAQQTAGKGAN